MGGVWAWFFIPETAGRSLEGMDELFKLKWYQIGRMGEKFADDAEETKRQRALDGEKSDAEIQQIEIHEKGKRDV